MTECTHLYDNLLEEAKKAREFAYAPYSGFKVGAALLGKSGKIYTGCNVENSAYGNTVCAERTALVKAVSEGEKEFEAIAVIGDLDKPCSPCGSCRQTLAEFGDIMVIMANLTGIISAEKLSSLLPCAFEGHLKKGNYGNEQN